MRLQTIVQSVHFSGLKKKQRKEGLMAIATSVPSLPAKAVSGLPGRRYDHYFFSGMALAILLTVFLGFARTYYLAGVFNAPLPSRIIHLHGAVFTCWILLLVTQTSLVAAGRTDIHRRLGIAGFFLACLMVTVGVLAAIDQLAHRVPANGIPAKFFFIIPMSDMLIFGTLVFFAFRARFDSAAHKRLILVATVALMTAPIARWPFFEHRNLVRSVLISYLFLLMLLMYDLWSTRKVHRATIWACTFLIFIEQIRIPIAKTAVWQTFASWAQTLAP
jgi:hypothetical protein